MFGFAALDTLGLIAPFLTTQAESDLATAMVYGGEFGLGTERFPRPSRRCVAPQEVQAITGHDSHEMVQHNGKGTQLLGLSAP